MAALCMETDWKLLKFDVAVLFSCNAILSIMNYQNLLALEAARNITIPWSGTALNKIKDLKNSNKCDQMIIKCFQDCPTMKNHRYSYSIQTRKFVLILKLGNCALCDKQSLEKDRETYFARSGDR